MECTSLSRKNARTLANHEVVTSSVDILLSQSKLIPTPPSLLNQKFSIIVSAILGVAAEKRKAEKAAAKAAGIAPKAKASRKRKTPEMEAEEIDPAEDHKFELTHWFAITKKMFQQSFAASFVFGSENLIYDPFLNAFDKGQFAITALHRTSYPSTWPILAMLVRTKLMREKQTLPIRPAPCFAQSHSRISACSP